MSAVSSSLLWNSSFFFLSRSSSLVSQALPSSAITCNLASVLSVALACMALLFTIVSSTSDRRCSKTWMRCIAAPKRVSRSSTVALISRLSSVCWSATISKARTLRVSSSGVLASLILSSVAESTPTTSTVSSFLALSVRGATAASSALEATRFLARGAARPGEPIGPATGAAEDEAAALSFARESAAIAAALPLRFP